MVRTTTSSQSLTANRLPGLGIKLATGANALDTAAAIRAELAKMEPFFPSGLKIVYPYDTTPFVKISIHEVVKTLVEAIILVFLVCICICSCRLPRDIDSDHCRTGGIARDLCRPCRLWLLDKHANNVRDGARYRLVGG
ncbi:efflux RND transporter permease subunit [Escherichia coli]